MDSAKTVSKDTVSAIEGGDLYALLSVCDNDDLEPLVEIIISATTNSLESCKTYKIHRPNHKKYLKEIGDEIRSYGGHSVRNAMRGEGPPYAEIVDDVCDKLDVPCDKGKVHLNEERVLTNYIKMGKTLAKTILSELTASHPAGNHDSSTNGLIAAVRKMREQSSI